MDSRVCKAALIAGVISSDGGEVSAGGTCIDDNGTINVSNKISQ
jgi:hypothetical protein